MKWRVLSAWLVLAFAALPTSPASAQGFFDLLFGTGKLPQPVPRTYRDGDRSGSFQSYGDTGNGRGRTYRTLCVRLCDGYYFPISFSTPRSGLTHDADKCSAACGSEARLFYHPNPGGDIDTMIDLTGMSYWQLSTAFKYRKTLVKGCACRPQPWTEAERARHRGYAGEQLATASDTDGDRAVGTQSTPETIERPQVSALAEALVVGRPVPISRYVLPSMPQASLKQSMPRSVFGSSKVGSAGAMFR